MRAKWRGIPKVCDVSSPPWYGGLPYTFRKQSDQGCQVCGVHTRRGCRTYFYSTYELPLKLMPSWRRCDCEEGAPWWMRFSLFKERAIDQDKRIRWQDTTVQRYFKDEHRDFGYSVNPVLRWRRACGGKGKSKINTTKLVSRLNHRHGRLGNQQQIKQNCRFVLLDVYPKWSAFSKGRLQKGRQEYEVPLLNSRLLAQNRIMVEQRLFCK